MEKTPELFLTRAKTFTLEAHQIFSNAEDSPSRLIDVARTAKSIASLSGQQSVLLDEALKAAKYGLARAAHVSAWAALIDLVEHKLGEDGFVKLRTAMPNWKFLGLDELREAVNEYQILEAAKKVGLLSKAEMKSLQGMLSKRNECAHPSGYHPTYNEVIGYISEAIQRIQTISKKTL